MCFRDWHYWLILCLVSTERRVRLQMSLNDPYAIRTGYRYWIDIESSLGNEQKSKMVRRCNDTSCTSINFVSAMALNKTFLLVVTNFMALNNTSKNHTQQFLDHIPSIFSDICQFTIFNHTITANIIQVSKYSTSNSIVRLE